MAEAAKPAVAPASSLPRDNFIEISSLATAVTVDGGAPCGQVPVFAKACQAGPCFASAPTGHP
jgi:hypothetical protein